MNQKIIFKYPNLLYRTNLLNNEMSSYTGILCIIPGGFVYNVMQSLCCEK